MGQPGIAVQMNRCVAVEIEAPRHEMRRALRGLEQAGFRNTDSRRRHQAQGVLLAAEVVFRIDLKFN